MPLAEAASGDDHGLAAVLAVYFSLLRSLRPDLKKIPAFGELVIHLAAVLSACAQAGGSAARHAVQLENLKDGILRGVPQPFFLHALGTEPRLYFPVASLGLGHRTEVCLIELAMICEYDHLLHMMQHLVQYSMMGKHQCRNVF